VAGQEVQWHGSGHGSVVGGERQEERKKEVSRCVGGRKMVWQGVAGVEGRWAGGQGEGGSGEA